jgi:hypothetical protein
MSPPGKSSGVMKTVAEQISANEPIVEAGLRRPPLVRPCLGDDVRRRGILRRVRRIRNFACVEFTRKRRAARVRESIETVELEAASHGMSEDRSLRTGIQFGFVTRALDRASRFFSKLRSRLTMVASRRWTETCLRRCPHQPDDDLASFATCST